MLPNLQTEMPRMKLKNRRVVVRGAGDIQEPIKLSRGEPATVHQLVDVMEEIAGVKLHRRSNLDAPKGFNGLNRDNTKLRSYLDWEPSNSLYEGMARTYEWIECQMMSSVRR
jgi:GDP-D-mannose 3', 5'-epimerase